MEGLARRAPEPQRVLATVLAQVAVDPEEADLAVPGLVVRVQVVRVQVDQVPAAQVRAVPGLVDLDQVARGPVAPDRDRVGRVRVVGDLVVDPAAVVQVVLADRAAVLRALLAV